MKKFHYLILFFTLILPLTACANSSEEGLGKILVSKKAPIGVVFEIASADGDALIWAVPLVKSYSKRLRKRFPKIKLAVVSHGQEQFLLMSRNQRAYEKTHNQVVSLIQDDKIKIHVCGNYAELNGVDDEEFISSIDVAPAGPDQIDIYEEEGYETLFIYKPSK